MSLRTDHLSVINTIRTIMTQSQRALVHPQPGA